MGIIWLPPKSGYWSTAHARIIGLMLCLGLETVSMHVVSFRDFVSYLDGSRIFPLRALQNTIKIFNGTGPRNVELIDSVIIPPS